MGDHYRLANGRRNWHRAVWKCSSCRPPKRCLHPHLKPLRPHRRHQWPRVLRRVEPGPPRLRLQDDRAGVVVARPALRQPGQDDETGDLPRVRGRAAVPQVGESDALAVRPREPAPRLAPLRPFHSYQALAGAMQRRREKAPLTVAALSQVSTRQLKVVSLKPSPWPFSRSFSGLPREERA